MKLREEVRNQLREELDFNIQKYTGEFNSIQDIIENFSLTEEESTILRNDLIVISADYDFYCYDGTAEVYFFDTRDGKFYEVHGGHCSCYGLEGQWEPEVIGDLDFYKEYMRKKKQNN